MGRSGVIQSGHFSMVVHALNMNPSNAELREMLAQVGTESGEIEFTSFCEVLFRYYTESSMQELEAHLAAALSFFDGSGEGRLDFEELQRALQTQGEPLSDLEWEHLFQAAD